MDHLLIATQTLTLIIGIILNLYFFNIYRKEKNLFYFNIFIYFILTNIFSTGDLLFEYLFINIHHLQKTLPIILRWFLIMGEFLLLISIPYIIGQIFITLLNKKPGHKFNIIYFALVVIYAVMNIYNFVKYSSGLSYLTKDSYALLYMPPILFVILMLVFFLFLNLRIMRKEKMMEINLLIILFLTGYIIYSFFPVVRFTDTNNLYRTLTTLYLYSAIFIWFRIFHHKTTPNEAALPSEQITDIIRERFNITNREQDVLLLLLQGKNNKEMENILFVSYNTIKNHIAGLYKKLGVRSRGQLMNLVLKIQKGER